MKRMLLMAAAMLCLASVAVAQEKETPEVRYTPEAGEFSIGFDASPIFKYVGNLFNTSGNNSFEGFKGQPFTANLPDPSGLMPDVSLMGKYMLTDSWALKANIGLMLVGTKDKAYVQDDAAALTDPLAGKAVIDKMSTARTGVSLMLGGEYRLGKGRIQGVFGAGLLFALQNNSVSYRYGNAITEFNTKPSIADDNLWMSGDYRPLKRNNDGVNTYLGLTASAGVEWFVAPKISLGAEVNLSAYGVFGAKSYTMSEGYNASLGKVEQRTDLVSPGDVYLCLGTESLGGALYISFWF